MKRPKRISGWNKKLRCHIENPLQDKPFQRLSYRNTVWTGDLWCSVWHFCRKKKPLPGRLVSWVPYTFFCGGFKRLKPPQFFAQHNTGSAARGGNCHVAATCFSGETLLKKNLSAVWDRFGQEYVLCGVSKIHTAFHCNHWLCALRGKKSLLLRTFGAGRNHCNNINAWGGITVPDFSLSRRWEVKRWHTPLMNMKSGAGLMLFAKSFCAMK